MDCNNHHQCRLSNNLFQLYRRWSPAISITGCTGIFWIKTCAERKEWFLDEEKEEIGMDDGASQFKAVVKAVASGPTTDIKMDAYVYGVFKAA